MFYWVDFLEFLENVLFYEYILLQCVIFLIEVFEIIIA